MIGPAGGASMAKLDVTAGTGDARQMPEVVVRKRLGRRSGDWRYRLNRWFYRNRPKIAVIAAFGVACLLGLAAASMGLQSLSAGPSQAQAGTATPAQ
jgi:hypothetical protein